MKSPESVIKSRSNMLMSPMTGGVSLALMNGFTINRQRWFTLTIARRNERSEFLLSLGWRDPKNGPARIFTLEGDGKLFQSLEIPDALPPLTSFDEASDSQGHGTIQKVGFCTAQP